MAYLAELIYLIFFLFAFFWAKLAYYLQSFIEYRIISKLYDTAIGAWSNMNTRTTARIIVGSPEIVSYGVYIQVQL